MALEAGTRIGKFTIVRMVAQGGMAEVYRADQELAPGITRPSALKVIRAEYSESPDFRQMFLDEARTACTLSHPNIVHIYEVGESDEGQLFMAMELVTGETLATINRTLRQHGDQFTIDALFSIGIATCAALEAVHALKVEGGNVNLVHRDVSPHNLLLASSGTLKLIDFGIAKAVTNQNLTMPGITKGKAGYFSPEQAMGKKLDGRSDIFSVGVTLYKLAFGNTPFDEHRTHMERNSALVRGEWKRLGEVMPELPASFIEVVDKSMRVDPAERFQTAGEMREALEHAAFEAGLRTGPSALTGYIDVDGEITATSKRPLVGNVKVVSTTSSPKLRPAMAEAATQALPETRIDVRPASAGAPAKPPPPQTESPPYLLMLGAFTGALVLGVVAILWLMPEKREKALPQDIRVIQEPPKPVVVKPPEPEVVDAGLQVAQVEPVPVEPPPEKPVELPPVPVVLPRHVEPVKPVPVVAVVPVKPPAPPTVRPVEITRTFAPGQEKFRIKPSADVAEISVDGKVAATPENMKVETGYHLVTIKLLDGRTFSHKCAVEVGRPNRVLFDVEKGTWTEQ